MKEFAVITFLFVIVVCFVLSANKNGSISDNKTKVLIGEPLFKWLKE